MSGERSYGLIIIDKITITLFGLSLFNNNERDPIDFNMAQNQTDTPLPPVTFDKSDIYYITGTLSIFFVTLTLLILYCFGRRNNTNNNNTVRTTNDNDYDDMNHSVQNRRNTSEADLIYEEPTFLNCHRTHFNQNRLNNNNMNAQRTRETQNYALTPIINHFNNSQTLNDLTRLNKLRTFGSMGQ